MHTCTEIIFRMYDIPSLPAKPCFITLCQTLVDLCQLLPGSKAPEVIVSVLALAVLIVVKELSACYRKKLPLPIPIELIVVGLLLWRVDHSGQVTPVAQSYLNCGVSSFNRSLRQQSSPTSVILEINTALVLLERFPVGKPPTPLFGISAT